MTNEAGSKTGIHKMASGRAGEQSSWASFLSTFPEQPLKQLLKYSCTLYSTKVIWVHPAI